MRLHSDIDKLCSALVPGMSVDSLASANSGLCTFAADSSSVRSLVGIVDQFFSVASEDLYHAIIIS